MCLEIRMIFLRMSVKWQNWYYQNKAPMILLVRCIALNLEESRQKELTQATHDVILLTNM